MPAILKYAGKALLFLSVAVLLLLVVVPHYLDRRYYRGAEGGHFDGARFFNPDGGEDGTRPPGRGGRFSFFWRSLTDDRPPWPTTVPVRPATASELLARPTAPITGPASPEAERASPMRATWVGHATVLVQTPALNILSDPVWSDHAGPFFLGPRRVARPGIDLATLPRIDLVLVSHNHYDHLDLTTLKAIWDRDRPLIVTSLGNDAILRSAGIGAVAADWGRSITVEGRPRVDATHYGTRPIRVHVTRNHHWSSRWFADRNRALWSSFVVELPGGNLFFAGDTGLGDGRWPAEARRFGPIRLALIPIGAFRFEPGQMSSDSHVGPVQAAAIHGALGASTSLPIHWGTFRLSYEGYRTPPDLLRATLRCTGQRGFRVARIGRPVDVPPFAAPPAPAPIATDRLRACLHSAGADSLR